MREFFFFNREGKKCTGLLKFSYLTSIFQGISLGPKHFVGVYKDWLDLITAMLIKINYTHKKFLLLAISGKERLFVKNVLSFVSCYTILSSIKTLWLRTPHHHGF